MKTIELSGIIKFDYSGDWKKIFLVQPDGYKIDLIGRFMEIKESLNKKIQVNYYLSNKSKTKDEMIEVFLRKLYGDCNAEYEANTCGGSSWTGDWIEYDSTLIVGGHNLFEELQDREGKFVYFEIYIQEN